MRVLVVDDDLVSMAIASATVESLGHECREAGDGVAALQEMRAGDIDVVVRDWQMPVLDGLELCRQCRQEPAFPYPIFFCSPRVGLRPTWCRRWRPASTTTSSSRSTAISCRQG